MIWLLGVAFAADVLVVGTPGVERVAYVPLTERLRADGHQVRFYEPDCTGDSATISSRIAGEVGEGDVVVAHGVGATLALMQAQPARFVLLAPVLDVVPVGVTTWLSEQPVGPSVDLSTRAVWEGSSVATLLVDDLPLRCAPAELVREAQQWIADERVPLDLASVSTPVWMAVSAGDDVAALESTVHASRALPNRELARLGVNAFQAQDFSHAEMLSDRRVLRAASRALSSR